MRGSDNGKDDDDNDDGGNGDNSDDKDTQVICSHAQAAFVYLQGRRDLDRQRIVIFGRSLGGAVAVDAGSVSDYSKHVAAVIVENTFTSIPDMGDLHVPLARFLPRFLIRNRFSNIDKVTPWLDELLLVLTSMAGTGCSIIDSCALC
jgi:fermentation-respiration switch protein FrsA (DUF1100 family)